jgi:hypothetical protein
MVGDASGFRLCSRGDKPVVASNRCFARSRSCLLHEPFGGRRSGTPSKLKQYHCLSCLFWTINKLSHLSNSNMTCIYELSNGSLLCVITQRSKHWSLFTVSLHYFSRGRQGQELPSNGEGSAPQLLGQTSLSTTRKGKVRGLAL